MKKRRTMVIALFLVAALALGIGYAALSRELVISSTANLAPNDDNFDIVFTSAEVNPADAGKATASVTGTGTTANYTVTGLSKEGDNVTMTFVITNRTVDVDASLLSLSQTAGDLYIGDGTSTPGVVSDFFTKEVTIKNDDTGAVYNGTDDFTLAPGKTATVTVKITLEKTVTDKVTLTGASILLDFQGEN